MSEAHLGNRIHDLLDNRLSAEQTADAMAHLDACADCRVRWDDLRSAREALRTSSAGIDMTFARQLLDRDHMAAVARGESKHVARAASGRGHNPVLMLAIVMAVLGASVGALYSLGAPEEVTLASAEGSADQAAAVPVTFYEPSSMRSGEALRDWASPAWDSADLVPVEAKVVTDSDGEIVLVQSLLAGLDTIVVTEQRGTLVDDLDERFDSAEVNGFTVFLVGDNPRQIVWQCGEIVISASCDCAADTLEAVAAAFPSHDPAGVLDRVVDGVERIAEAVTGN